MYETREYFNNKFYQILISDEIVTYSYPNKNYNQIANSHFLDSMTQIESKFSNQLEQLLINSKNPLFLNAHGGEKNNNWVIYNTEFEYFEINDFLKKQIQKYDVDSCIVYSCNPNDYKIKLNSIPIFYANKKISCFIQEDQTFSLINV